RGWASCPTRPRACLGPMAPTVLPAHTAPPLTVSRHLVDPRRAWMDVHTVSKSMNGLDVIHAWRGSTCRPRSTPTNSSRNLSKAGWVRLRGRERHGWRDRAYRDVLAASPATGPTPPSLRKPASAVASAVAVASAGAGRSPAEHPLLDRSHLYVDHAVAYPGLQCVTRLYLLDPAHECAILCTGHDAVATRDGRQRTDRFQRTCKATQAQRITLQQALQRRLWAPAQRGKATSQRLHLPLRMMAPQHCGSVAQTGCATLLLLVVRRMQATSEVQLTTAKQIQSCLRTLC